MTSRLTLRETPEVDALMTVVNNTDVTTFRADFPHQKFAKRARRRRLVAGLHNVFPRMLKLTDNSVLQAFQARVNISCDSDRYRYLLRSTPPPNPSPV